MSFLKRRGDSSLTLGMTKKKARNEERRLVITKKARNDRAGMELGDHEVLEVVSSYEIKLQILAFPSAIGCDLQ